ncbi:hypothetical protein FA95DRAFT_769401 [Auriscalpium vulgare]|uniref:Uncharacterized protein n=1 Tax=Auriscalpium vulgare TaxID=40419 RepID=A0ACB8RC48_9AGAM|nr:hypothetical protein FA95DRAFT_769401 [Auriscalpium vulgare]
MPRGFEVVHGGAASVRHINRASRRLRLPTERTRIASVWTELRDQRALTMLCGAAVALASLRSCAMLLSNPFPVSKKQLRTAPLMSWRERSCTQNVTTLGWNIKCLLSQLCPRGLVSKSHCEEIIFANTV